MPQVEVLVTGGAGYIGSVLVPKLLARGHRVVVLDLMLFDANSLDAVAQHPNLTLVRGDIRDGQLLEDLLGSRRFDAVIHLAAISNDPCSELDPELTRQINLVATTRLMAEAKRHGVRRFLNASSASVYGLKEEEQVTEELSLEPRTIYARCKADTEQVLEDLVDEAFCGVSVRAATVCGWSPRLRLDLTINILTSQALSQGRIRVFGGSQQRPNVHVQDLADFYARLLELEPERINGRAFNVSCENATVYQLAEMVRAALDPSLPIVVEPTADDRSYRLSARRAREELGFSPTRPLSLAVEELRDAFADGRVADPGAAVYRNIEVMKRAPTLLALRTPSA